MAPEPALHDVLTPDEVRGEIERMIASSVFASSPQLSAFLRFVVEAVLNGRADRLKGYVIGIEVLRRDKNFDPQIDPIVRVEATRLRRAIERYYAGPGANDPIIIDLPRGGYVPQFSRRDHLAPAAGDAAPELAVVSSAAAPRPIGNGLPTLRVAPFVVSGAPDTRTLIAERLSGKRHSALQAARRARHHDRLVQAVRAARRRRGRGRHRAPRHPRAGFDAARTVWHGVGAGALPRARRHAHRSALPGSARRRRRVPLL
jgi:hypothetical protein